MGANGFPYTIRRGDTLSGIARRFGISTWQEIYYHDRNEKFRISRPNPNLIYPNDNIWIPASAANRVSGSTGGSLLAIETPKADLVVKTVDNDNSSPLEGVDIAITGPEFLNGVTDKNGEFPFSHIEPGRYVVQAVKAGYHWETASAFVKRDMTNQFQVKLTKSPNAGSATNGNEIDLVFNPSDSRKISKCSRIVHVQFIRIYVDDKVIKPSLLIASWTYRDKVMTDDGWWIDHLQKEMTPDYQQGNGDGRKNGGVSNATIKDIPNIGSDTVRAPYDPANNLNGWKAIRYEFTTFPWCMGGDDCGKWYEGVQWEYRKTWEDHRDGKNGVSEIIDNNVVVGPSKSHLDAFSKFNKKKGFVPCT